MTEAIDAGNSEDLNKLLELTESEFRCGICHEVVIKCAVVNCGHSFCHFCITKWTKTNEDCPACGDPCNQKVPHVQLDSFIQKAYNITTNEQTKTQRRNLIEAREKEEKEEDKSLSGESNSASGSEAHQSDLVGAAYGLPTENFILCNDVESPRSSSGSELSSIFPY